MEIPSLGNFSTIVGSESRFETPIPVSYTNRISYTNKDIASIRKSILNIIPTLTEDWTDFSESDIGVALIETLSGVADLLNFYLDNQALETYITTARQRKNMKALLSLVGQRMHMTKSSEGSVLFTLKEPWLCDIVIPKGTSLSTTEFTNQIQFVTTKEVVIPQGKLQVEAPVLQGELITHKLTVNQLRTMNSQVFTIPTKNVALGSVNISMDGVAWSEVPDVFLTTEGGKVFSVAEDKNDNAYITLSYNYLSELPINKDAEIIISYLSSLGTEGNVSMGTIDRILSNILDLQSNKVTHKLVVHNPSNTSGGAPREDIEHARKYSASKVRTMGAAVTLEDYNTFIRSYPGVEKAIALDWSIPGNYVEVPYLVKAYVVPQGGGTPSAEFLKSITDYLDSIRIIATRVEIYSAIYKPVNVDVDIYTSIPVAEYESLRVRTEKLLRDHFRSSNQEFSKGVRPSNITTLIQSSSQDIDYITLNSPSSAFNLRRNEFPVLGDLSVKIHATT